jgi:putative hydrolase of the HAD superfamily
MKYLQGMSMKAVGFDLGETLIYYEDVPLSWKDLYREALIQILHELNVPCTDEFIDKGEQVLSLYNTRINPREVEIKDTEVFEAVISAWGVSNRNVDQAVKVFFRFFQQRSKVYEDAVTVLKELKQGNVSIGILTDVPYGMNKTLVLRDIEPIREYIDVIVTSVDAGYRKPRPEGFIQLSQKLGIARNQMLYVGNEEKDIAGANRSGVTSVWINREGQHQDWNQQYTITGLTELMDRVIDGEYNGTDNDSATV